MSKSSILWGPRYQPHLVSTKFAVKIFDSILKFGNIDVGPLIQDVRFTHECIRRLRRFPLSQTTSVVTDILRLSSQLSGEFNLDNPSLLHPVVHIHSANLTLASYLTTILYPHLNSSHSFHELRRHVPSESSHAPGSFSHIISDSPQSPPARGFNSQGFLWRNFFKVGHGMRPYSPHC